jgi:hypothetical protein
MYRTVLLKYFWQILDGIKCCSDVLGDTSSGMWNSPSDTRSAIIWRLSFHSLRSWNSIEEKILSYFFLIMQFYGGWGTFVSLTTQHVRETHRCSKIQLSFSFFIQLIFLECNTVLWGTSISEVNKWGMFCFDLVIFFAIQKSFQEKMSCYAMFCMFFLCNSGQFSFFHVLLNEKHSIYSQNLPFLQFFVVIQWFQMEMSEYFAWI